MDSSNENWHFCIIGIRGRHECDVPGTRPHCGVYLLSHAPLPRSGFSQEQDCCDPDVSSGRGLQEIHPGSALYLHVICDHLVHLDCSNLDAQLGGRTQTSNQDWGTVSS